MMKTRYFMLTVILLAGTGRFYAQTPDPGFGSSGQVLHFFSNAYTANHQSGYLQDDGKILNVGYGYEGNFLATILVTRHLSDGTLDTTFNTTGALEFTFGQNYEEANSIIRLADGRICVGGASFGNAVLAVLNNDGSLDNTFGTNGKKFITLGQGNGSKIEKLLEQPDGKILAFGRAHNGNDFDFMAARINPDGSFDSTFATNGMGLYPTSTFHDFAMDAGFQSSGKIVIGGYSTGSQDAVSLIRIHPNGGLDSTFATNGVFNAYYGSSLNEIEGVAVQPDDKIIMAGRVSGGLFNSVEALTLRFTPNGALDISFNNQGYVVTDFRDDTQDEVNDVLVMPDGNILIVGGSDRTTGGTDFALLQYLPDGSIDAGFGTSGRYFAPVGTGNVSWVNEAVMQPDGKLLLCGLAVPNAGDKGQFGMLRLTDLSFVSELPPADDWTISLYPNPADHQLQVSVPEALLPVSMSISTLTGACMLSEEVCHQPTVNMDVTAYPPGVYFLSITSGGQRSVRAFIKR